MPLKFTVKKREVKPTELPKDRPKQGEFPQFGGKSTPWSRAEIVAALMWANAFYSRTFDAEDMPRGELAKAFGVSRYTIHRCIRDIQRGKDLAVQVGNMVWGEENASQSQVG